MAKHKETIATVSFSRKPDWRYWPCVERNGQVVVLGSSDSHAARTVARTRFFNVPGSSYELAGSKVIRTFDPRYEAKEAAKRSIRQAKLARLRAPGFARRVRAFARRIDANIEILETEEFDELVTAVYRLRLSRKLPLDWLLSPASVVPGGFVYAFAVDVGARNGTRIDELAVVPTEDASDVVRLVQTSGEVAPTQIAQVMARLAREANVRITVASPRDHLLGFRLLTACKAVDKHARALYRLHSFAETTIADLRKQLQEGDVLLWWD